MSGGSDLCHGDECKLNIKASITPVGQVGWSEESSLSGCVGDTIHVTADHDDFEMLGNPTTQVRVYFNKKFHHHLDEYHAKFTRGQSESKPHSFHGKSNDESYELQSI
jgi:hypothetical protein